MVTESQKYRAQFLQVSGFCLMTPMGKLVLEFLDIGWNDLTIKFSFYLIVTLVLTYLGIMFVIRGMEILEYGEQKWTQ